MCQQMVTIGLPNCSRGILQTPFHLLTVVLVQQFRRLIQRHCFLTWPVDILKSRPTWKLWWPCSFLSSVNEQSRSITFHGRGNICYPKQRLPLRGWVSKMGKRDAKSIKIWWLPQLMISGKAAAVTGRKNHAPKSWWSIHMSLRQGPQTNVCPNAPC